MADLVERVKIIDSSGLPEEFQGVEIFGKSEQGRGYRQLEDGERKLSGNATSLVMRILVSMGKAEYLPPEDEAMSPEVAVLLQEIENLNTTIQEERKQHEAQLEQLLLEREQLESKWQTKLDEELQKLRAEFEDQISQLKRETEPEITPPEPDAVAAVEPDRPEAPKDDRVFPGSLVDVDWPDGEKGWGMTAVSGIWKGPDGKEHITYMTDEGPRWAPIDSVSIHEDSWESEPVASVPLESTTPAGGPLPEDKPLSWRERMSDWFTLRRPVTYLQTRLQTRRVVGGGPEDVEEVEVTEERPSAAAYAGGLILAAVLGGVIAWELKNNGHSHTKEFHTIINQNNHLKTEVHTMHQTLDQDSKVITQNHTLLNENHRILKHNRAVLKHLHEQVHHLFKIEKAESARELSATGAGGGEAKLSFYGDTVWHETARRLNHASAAQIRKATDYVLRINGLRWNGGGSGVDAHKLPLGFTFRIPKNIFQIANR